MRAPTGVAIWPRDLALAPRSLAERLYNIRRYTVMPRGGHVPAWEAPELYARDLRRLAGAVLSFGPAAGSAPDLPPGSPMPDSSGVKPEATSRDQRHQDGPR